MTTTQAIIEAGYSRSTSNDPGKLAGDLELIGYLNRRFQARYATLALASGDNCITSTTLTFNGAPAAAGLPPDIIDLARLETLAGAKAHIIPMEEKERAWHQTPAVYRQGLSLVSRGKAGDPVAGGQLVLFYIDAPTALSVLASPLDGRWPVRFESLLVNDIALYLSTKDDGRDNSEYEELLKETAGLEKEFKDMVSGSDYAKERPAPDLTAGPTAGGGQ